MSKKKIDKNIWEQESKIKNDGRYGDGAQGEANSKKPSSHSSDGDEPRPPELETVNKIDQGKSR